MSDRESVITRLIARVRALLPEDWFGRAGERLQKTTAAISDFAEEHNIRPKELLEETVDLGRRKIEGLANREYAAAAKDFAEAEEKKIDIELKRRTLDIKVRKEEAEARAAEIQNLNAEFELLEKLQKANVVIHRDESGNLTVLPTPPNCDLAELIEQKRLSEPIVGRANIESEVFVRESHGLKLFFEALHGYA